MASTIVMAEKEGTLDEPVLLLQSQLQTTSTFNHFLHYVSLSMLNLRDLTWPHLVPNRQPSLSSNLAPTSKSSSIRSLTVQLEAESPHRQSSEGTRPAALHLNHKGSHILSPGVVTQLFTMLPPTIPAADVDMSLAPSLTIHSSFKDGQEMLPQQSNLNQEATSAVTIGDSTVDDLGETPMSVSQFEFGSRESFNTGVQDLVQQAPDTPIGGPETSPSESPILTNRELPLAPQSTPQVEVPAPRLFSSKALFPSSRPVLHPRSNRSRFSESFNACGSNQVFSANLERLSSAAPAAPTIIALESPIYAKEINYNNLSVDGATSEVNVKDSTVATDLALPECCVSLIIIPQDERHQSMAATGIETLPQPLSNNINLPSAKEITKVVENPTSSNGTPTTISKTGHDAVLQNVTGLAAVPEVKSMANPNNVTSLATLSKVESMNIPKNSTGLAVVPEIRSTAIPEDVTGLASTLPSPLPDIDIPVLKSKKGSIRKVYRMGRRVVLRKRILIMIVGRDLAGPTQEIIRLASKTCGTATGAANSTTSAAAPVTSVTASAISTPAPLISTAPAPIST